jgi:4-alpha-glucanotransferase
MLTHRHSGLLLHPTSLPGAQPIGSLGREAYEFVDFLLATGQSVWQILPLGPVGFGHCPYSSFSAFAGNPLLINLHLLAETGDLHNSDLPAPFPGSETADFDAALRIQLPVLHLAYKNFRQRAASTRQHNFNQFCFNQAYWLDDHAFFEAMRENQRYSGWQHWPDEIRQREPSALHRWSEKLHDSIYWHQYVQFVFFEQWAALKKYANNKGIRIVGDLPFFVAEDSADVWANRELFYLDEKDQASLVAGVPPDYFSKTGQRWGNPLYRWDRMAKNNFSWWQARLHWNLDLFDLLRVDHFRGFSACWAIPETETTAENGSWMEVPGMQLFSLLQEKLGPLPIIAEDLGIITPDVEQLRDHFGFPGMKILQFAFDSGPANPYLPANHLPNSVIYTGTHDNNTSLGWWNALDPAGKQRVRDYLQNPCKNMPCTLIETAMASISDLVIIPVQDILSLPAATRMNTPGTATGNWQWRVQSGALTAEICEQLKNLSHLYGRDLCIPAEI